MAPSVADWRLTSGHHQHTFLPIAEKLIDNVFPTHIERSIPAIWGPHTTPAPGTLSKTPRNTPARLACSPGAASEAGGVGEDYEIRLWIHHGTSGMPELPKTGDVVEYDATQWRVVTVDPTYSSEGLIASKLTCRGN